MSDISDQETPTDQTVPTHRGLARLSRDEAHRLSVELVKHYPTTGMRASMGVTCQCGFHETRNLRRRSGNDGLDVHRAETAMSIPPSPERAILTDLIAELRAEHYPHPCTDPEDFPCEHRQRVAVAQLWARNVRTTEILLGLIAELRAYARYTYTEYTLIENALDRAETRLEGLSDE